MTFRQGPPAYGRRSASFAATLFAALTFLASATSAAPAQQATAELSGKLDELETNVRRQGSLQDEIAAQNVRINDLVAKESELRRRETAVQAVLDERQAELDEATAQLESGQAQLAETQARLDRALISLERLLVGVYKSSEPDTLSVILDSEGFEDLVSRGAYVERIHNYEQSTVERVRSLREQIANQVEALASARATMQTARDEIAVRRQELSEASEELAGQHADLSAARRERESSLAVLRDRQDVLEKDLGTSIPGPGETAELVGQTAIAPPGAPLQIKAVIESANQISDKPYIWGGGHGSFEDDGYDCSGAVSFALHGGGLIDSPLDSSGFEAWAQPGVGNWITIYTESGHMYAVIAGLRFDTGGPGGGNGPRWSTTQRSPAGFFPRHPAGL